MGRETFDFLTESVLWSARDQSEEYAALDESELLNELALYRKHVLALSDRSGDGLSVALSARDGSRAPESVVKRSVLYFDEVLLPDPVFRLSAWTTKSTFPRQPAEVPRGELVGAVRWMRALLPFVRLGRVRFVPSSQMLEGPEQSLLLYSEDNFEERVPPELRAWFRERADVRKVVFNEKGEGLVLTKAPDLETDSIQVDFGQLGTVHAYHNMRIIDLDEETRRFTSMQAPPETEAALHVWIEQSINRSAAGFLNDVQADAVFAWKRGCSFITSCPVAADLLDRVTVQGVQPRPAPGLVLELPVVEAASIEQLAELVEREPAAFAAFRQELHAVTESLAEIEESEARSAATKRAVDRLAREQVHAVEAKISEARRALKWDVPISAAQLAAGMLGVFGDPNLTALTAGLVTGGAKVASAVRKQFEHRTLPGYFLWRVKNAKR